eukprot:gene8572-9485_t
MDQDLKIIARTSRDTAACLEQTRRFIDQNTELANQCYQKIRNSNRMTKSKVKEGMARAKHNKKLAMKLLENHFEQQLQLSLQEDDFDVSMLPPDETQPQQKQPHPTELEQNDESQPQGRTYVFVIRKPVKFEDMWDWVYACSCNKDEFKELRFLAESIPLEKAEFYESLQGRCLHKDVVGPLLLDFDVRSGINPERISNSSDDKEMINTPVYPLMCNDMAVIVWDQDRDEFGVVSVLRHNLSCSHCVSSTACAHVRIFKALEGSLFLPVSAERISQLLTESNSIEAKEEELDCPSFLQIPFCRDRDNEREPANRKFVSHKLLRRFMVSFLHGRMPIYVFRTVYIREKEKDGYGNLDKGLTYNKFKSSCKYHDRILVQKKEYCSLLQRYAGTNRQRKKPLSAEDFELLMEYLRENNMEIHALVDHLQQSTMIEDHQYMATKHGQRFRPSPFSCPKPWRYFIEALSSSTPVCGLLHPDEELLAAIGELLHSRNGSDTDILCVLENKFAVLQKIIISVPNFRCPEVLFPVLQLLREKATVPFTNNEDYHIILGDQQPSIYSCWPILREQRRRGGYAMDDKKTDTGKGSCQKISTSHPSLLPGIFTIFCEHG